MALIKNKNSVLAKVTLSAVITLSMVSINSYAVNDEPKIEETIFETLTCKILPQCKEKSK